MAIAVNLEAKKVESAKYRNKCLMHWTGFCVMYDKETCDCIDECKSYGEAPTLKKKDRLNIREDFSSKWIVIILINEEPFTEKYLNHILTGNFAGFSECNIEPDWLLIYTVEDGFLKLARTGTHSDLFKK